VTEPQSLREQRIWNKVRMKTKYADATAAALARRGIAFASALPKSGQQLQGALFTPSADLHDQRPGSEFNHDPLPAIE